MRTSGRAAPGINLDDTERLIHDFTPLITSIAKRLAPHLPPYLDVDDLIHIGVLGLLDARTKYDSRREVTFKTYAAFRIRGAMIDELRSLDWVPRAVRQKQSAIAQASHRLEQRDGQAACHEDIATVLGLPMKKFWRWRTEVGRTSLASLDRSLVEVSDGTALTLMDVVSADEAQNPAQLVEDRDCYALVAEAVDALPVRERTVITLYYYHDLPMKDIGLMVGLTDSRISQIHLQAIAHLRSMLAATLGRT